MAIGVLAAISAAMAVAAGAFGAHGAAGPQQAEWLRTGGLYQLIHAVAALAIMGFARGLGDHAAGGRGDLCGDALCDGARRAEMAGGGDADRRDVADRRLAMGGVAVLAGVIPARGRLGGSHVADPQIRFNANGRGGQEIPPKPTSLDPDFSPA